MAPPHRNSFAGRVAYRLIGFYLPTCAPSVHGLNQISGVVMGRVSAASARLFIRIHVFVRI
jgi:hypothetical protein